MYHICSPRLDCDCGIKAQRDFRCERLPFERLGFEEGTGWEIQVRDVGCELCEEGFAFELGGRV